MATAVTSAPPRAKGGVPVLVIAGSVAAGLVVLLVLFGGWITPHDPAEQDLLLGAAGPGPGHPLGTDSLGRDVLSQLIAGTRIAVTGPLVVAAGTVLIGATLGMIAAYYGGVVDAVTNRFADLMYALPGLLVIIVVVGVVGGGYWFAVAVLTVLSVPAEIRLCRSATLVQTRLPYIEAARTLGLSGPRIMFRHILPNIAPTVIATFLLDFVGALIGLSGLSFLGLGTPPGTPDWGAMLQEGQALLTVNPWMSLAPGLMIIVTAAGVTLIGDWMYDRYSSRGEQR
ncbi:ABC transporter permease [Nonomuraea bangladeshensis]|uniref:ABC transporter permease n=1 Tax=Nonomuraea bangladeshensis TaxID=404385 RepID=UPI0031D277B3